MIFEKKYSSSTFKWAMILLLTLVVSFIFKGSYYLATNDMTAIPNETLEDYHYQNKNNHKNNKFVALTFDDGPDGKYTGEILSILNEYKVPATFFMIGSKVNQNKDLVKRIYASKHEIGNHTYTHSKDAHSSETRIQLELNATSKVIENVIGVYPRLYRPPFLMNMKDEITFDPASENKTLSIISSHGYIPLGIDNDSKDWHNSKPEVLLKRVISNVYDGKRMILLHDGGAEGKHTAEALILMIKRLKKDGYKFVKASTLLGMDESEAYYKPNRIDDYFVGVSIQELNKGINKIAIATLDMIGPTLSLVMKSLMFLVVFKIFLMILLFLKSCMFPRNIKYSNQNDKLKLPSVDVIVPVYNEEKNIAGTLLSLVNSSLLPSKIIVIDDGSSDNSYNVIKEVQNQYPDLIDVMSIQNIGKSGALNRGIKTSKSDVIIALDGDTVFLENTIEKLLINFLDPTVGAVAGKVQIANAKNYVESLQDLEYISGQNLEKRALGEIHGVGVVPGAVGAWSREFLESVGGFSTETLVEDRDLTLEVHAAGKKVVYAPDAIALTEAPHDVKNFAKQRFRWIYGSIQCFWKHKHDMFARKNKSLGFIILPSLLLFDIIIPLFYPLIDLVAISSLVFADAQSILLYYSLLYLSLDLFMTSLAFLFEDQRKSNLLWLIPIQKLLYRPIVSYCVIRSVFKAMNGNKVEWDSVEKIGSAQSSLKTIEVLASSSLSFRQNKF